MLELRKDQSLSSFNLRQQELNSTTFILVGNLARLKNLKESSSSKPYGNRLELGF
jgi:hypothetical protein